MPRLVVHSSGRNLCVIEGVPRYTVCRAPCNRGFTTVLPSFLSKSRNIRQASLCVLGFSGYIGRAGNVATQEKLKNQRRRQTQKDDIMVEEEKKNIKVFLFSFQLFSIGVGARAAGKALRLFPELLSPSFASIQFSLSTVTLFLSHPLHTSISSPCRKIPMQYEQRWK